MSTIPSKRELVKDFVSIHFGEHMVDEMLEGLMNAFHVKSVAKGDILFIEGEPGRYIYHLHKGVIKLYRTTIDGKEVVIHFVHEGDIFAEVVLKPNMPYPVTSEALEESVVVGLDVSVLYKLMRSDELFMKNFTAMLAWRMKELVNNIYQLTSQDVRSRLYSYMQNLAERSDSGKFKLPVARKELALLLGVAPETMSRVMRKLVDDGIIEIDGSNIRILKELEIDSE